MVKALPEYDEKERSGIVKGALPGQRVSFYVKRLREDSFVGELKEIIQRSETEDDSLACSYRGICGGCAYQGIPYETELCWKEAAMKELFRGLLPEELYEGILRSPSEKAYRNKMEYSFGDEKRDGEMVLGLHRKKSRYDLVSTEDCNIVPEDFRVLRKEIEEFFREKGIPYYHKRTQEGYLRYLVLRRGVKTSELQINLVTNLPLPAMDEEGLLREFSDRIQSLPLQGRIRGILHTLSSSVSDAIKPEKITCLYGTESFEDRILSLTFEISPFSFFQTNTEGAEILYSKVLEYLPIKEDSLVLDLYSGTGTIGQLMASKASRVIGIELVPEAVEKAKRNAEKNGLTNCEFIAGDVFRVLDNMEVEPDLIVVDPPRDGLSPDALRKVLSYKVPQIVYISCKASSLVRDLPTFFEEGYRPLRWANVDMFPRTTGVETVCLLAL